MNKLLAIYTCNFSQYCYNSQQQLDISEISVVPNPYIISSGFNEATKSNRLRFTHSVIQQLSGYLKVFKQLII